MSGQSQSRRDLWAFPTLLLWLVFMFMGLLSELMFYALREAGYVLTQDAIVNSPYAITIAFSLFLAYFVYHWCLEAGGSTHEACAKAVQTGLVGLLAFMPIPVGLFFQAGDIMNLELRLIVLTLIPFKMACWLYLLSIPLRYYALGNRQVCRRMWCIFPSASWTPEGEETSGADDAQEPAETEDAHPTAESEPSQSAQTPTEASAFRPE